jgi:nucleoid DNA-binding protein
MASRIKAINAYRPKIELGKRAATDDLVEFIARSTGLNESGVRQVLLELRDAVLFYNLRGQPVKLEGLGTYTPVIQLNGEFKVGHRADMALKRGLNNPGEFRGDIENRENAGKTSDEVVVMWNEEHPDDPVA